MHRFTKILTILCLALSLSAPSAATAQSGVSQKIESLEFRDSTVGEAVRLISRLSGVNIFATQEATDRKLSLTVNDTTVRGVIASIARVTGLSYSYDEQSNAFLIMTNEQFADDVVIARDAEIKVFTLRHQNVVSTAKVIESLFGNRVELTLNTDDPDRLEISQSSVQQSRTVASRVSRSVNTSNRNGRSSNGEIDPNKLNSQRLQQLVGPGGGNTQVLDMSEVAQQFALEQDIYITINREHNLLYVRTTDKAAMRDIARIIRETDRPTKQVLLEVRVMSLDLTDDFASSFNFGLTGGEDQSFTSMTGAQTSGRNGINSTGSGTGNLFFQYINDNLMAQLNLLENRKKARTLSTPMLSASNNSPARLFVGQEAVLVRGFSYRESDNTGNVIGTADTELRDVGQTLEILPRINADDTVTLVIQQENSTVIADGATLPVVVNGGAVREVDIDTVSTARVGGTVTTRSGATIAVGGLITDTSSDSNDKTPVLGDVPVLGKLFRSDENRNKRSELILLITPHIYSGGPDGERKARERLSRISRNTDVDTQGFAASDHGAPSVTLRGQKQNYASLTRYAANMRHGRKPANRGTYAGIDPVAVTTGGGLKLAQRSAVTAEAVESWRKQNLYVTAVVLTNTSSKPCDINVSRLRGSWLAATLEAPRLAPVGQEGSRTYLYLLSDRPYDDVIASFNAGSGL